MLQTKARRVAAAGLVAASLLITAPPANAGCNIAGGCLPGPGVPELLQPPDAPGIGTATPGASGGAITATAAWAAPNPYYYRNSTITGYRVHANRVEVRFDAYTQKVWWVVVGTTVSAVQPAGVRTLSMTLPRVGTYTFQVQAINAGGSSPFSAASNRVQGQ